MKSEERKIEYSKLKKYFLNQASAEETKLITGWLEEAESGLRSRNWFNQLWKDLEPEAMETSIDLETLLDKIHHAINLKHTLTAKKQARYIDLHSRPLFHQLLRNLGRVAAVALIFLTGYVSWEIYSQKMWVRSQAEIVYNEIQCPLGARSQFVLPDGTKGQLNNGSRLKYPVKFTGKTREVELFGEAFFDVTHNAHIPFIIGTVGLDIKVLGTRLNVYSYPDEDYQEITLESGSIKLIQRAEEEITIAEMKPGQHAVYRFGDSKNGIESKISPENVIILESEEQMKKAAIRLKPGTEALYKLDDGDMYLKYAATDRYIGWTQGELVLRNDPMPILLKRMERWYNVKFNIKDDEINEYSYWATFKEENLDQVLWLLSLTGPIRFEKLPRVRLDDGTFLTQEYDVIVK